MLSVRRNGAPTPWETCATLLRAVAGRSDVVAVTPLGSYFAMRLGDHIPQDHLFLHTPAESAEVSPGFKGKTRIPIVLDEHDRNRHGFNISPWLPAPPVPTFRRRRIDTLYLDSHRIGLLVLDCPTSAPAVLRGATRVLQAHLPRILVDLTTVPLTERIAVWEACVASAGPGYMWYDGMLLPCDTSSRREEAVFGCAARVACAMPTCLPDEMSIPPEAVSHLTAELRELAALSWTDWKDHVPVDPARVGGIGVAFDQNLPCRGLHPAETDGNGACWRWSGPGVRSTFVMPLPAPGSWRLRLHIVNWGVASEQGDIRVHAAGHGLEMLESGNHTAVFSPLNLPHLQATSSFEVEIVTKRTRSASADDPRRIGVCIAHCMLERS